MRWKQPLKQIQPRLQILGNFGFVLNRPPKRTVLPIDKRIVTNNEMKNIVAHLLHEHVVPFYSKIAISTRIKHCGKELDPRLSDVESCRFEWLYETSRKPDSDAILNP